jgi:ribonuclease HI
MTADFDGTFWGADFQDCTKAREELGCFNRGQQLHVQTRDKLRQILCTEGLRHNASKALDANRGNFIFSVFPRIEWCNEIPPPEPNVYSDGGVINPTSRAWAAGSFGVFWPNRALSLCSLNSVERDFAKHKEDPEGLCLWGNLHTPACSSTRAELVAAILAIAADGPIHLASDSKACISKARFYAQRIKHKHPQPCWANVTDGDLWAILWQVLADKSPSSVCFRKVKGHSTQEHVALGVISARDRDGNAKADELATLAQSTCDQMVGQLSTFFAERHKAYTQLVIKVHDFLLHMFRSIDRVRAEHMKAHQIQGGKLKKMAIEPSLPFPYSDESVSLDILALDSQTFQSMDKGSKQILATFCGRTWALAPQDTQGITWLELCLLFFLHGGSHHDLHFKGNSSAKPGA